MAVLKPGPLVADIRGKIGSEVFLRTQGGLTVRTIGEQPQPPSDPRDACQATLRELSKAWSGTLTPFQRSGWRAYAHTHPRPDRWGHRTITSGYLAFVRHNAHRNRDTQAIAYAHAPSAPPIHRPELGSSATTIPTVDVANPTYPAIAAAYEPAGVYGGKPAWKHPTAQWYIWWHISLLRYRISALPGELGSPRWAGPTNGDLYGTYTPNLPEFGDATAAAGSPATYIDVALPPANYDPPPAGLALYLFAGPPQPPGVSYFTGPWQYLGSNLYSPPWTHDPWRIPAPWPIPAGYNVYLYAVAQSYLTAAISGKGRSIAHHP